MILPDARDAARERGRLCVVIATIAINIPFYEEIARRINWWQYSGSRMISYTPWYIILGEFGIAVGFAVLARTLRRGSWFVAIVAGVAGGALIFVCYAAAFLITDRLNG